MARNARLIVLLLLAAPARAADGPPLAPTQCVSTLAVGGADSKARKVEARLTVDVMINGRGPYKFIVDSSADSSAVGQHIAHDLQLPLGKSVIVNGMTSREVVDRVKVGELAMGLTTVRNLQLPALREFDLGADGLLGIDAFGKQRLTMDFDQQQVRVEDAHRPAADAQEDIAFTARHQRGQLILTELKAAGIPVEATIHTGSEITVGNIALRDKLLASGVPTGTVEVMGVSGAAVKMELARVNELQLGRLLLRDVPVAFADAPAFAAWGLSDRPALLLGTDLMSRFSRVSVDFREGKVRFQPRRCTTDGS
jgi:hypothetical protein